MISIPNRDLYRTRHPIEGIVPHPRTEDVFDSNENRYNSSLTLRFGAR